MKAAVFFICLLGAARASHFGTVIPATEYRSRLIAAGIPEAQARILAGTHYALAKDADKLVDAIVTRVSRAHTVRHSPRNNCFAVSWAVVVFAGFQLDAEGAGGGQAVRPSVLAVSYRSREHGYHTILLVIQETGHAWIDPQNKRRVAMTPAELASVYFPRG